MTQIHPLTKRSPTPGGLPVGTLSPGAGLGGIQPSKPLHSPSSPSTPGPPSMLTPQGLSGGCQCHGTVQLAVQTLESAVMGSQDALRAVLDAIGNFDLTQWEGSAATLCHDMLQRMCSVINATDDELQVTLRMTTITGGTP
ncbi:MAG: hypothetical protein Q4G29_04600 [Pseudoscardovia radai]|nr:hypothetical protein [Pseudoscardovia radai]